MTKPIMEQICWCTDIHLNMVNPHRLREFLGKLSDSADDVLLISGDIGEADTITEYLTMLSSSTAGHIYFVLGNHDFYNGSVSDVRSDVRRLCKQVVNLTWLSDVGVIELSSQVALIGHDSWADGRYGDYVSSDMILNDHLLIRDFNPALQQSDNDAVTSSGTISPHQTFDYLTSSATKKRRLETMQSLAAESVEHVRKQLEAAFKNYEQVIFLTHVPPFAEICLNEGKPGDKAGLPHFSCKVVGDELIRICEQFSSRQLSVLCGHSHSEATSRILPNLVAFCGGAVYGEPTIRPMPFLSTTGEDGRD